MPSYSCIYIALKLKKYIFFLQKKRIKSIFSYTYVCMFICVCEYTGHTYFHHTETGIKTNGLVSVE